MDNLVTRLPARRRSRHLVRVELAPPASGPAWVGPSPRARRLGEFAGVGGIALAVAALALTPFDLMLAGVRLDLVLASIGALLVVPALLGTRAPPPSPSAPAGALRQPANDAGDVADRGGRGELAA